MELIRFPKAAENVTEGTVSRWLVSAGDRVERDHPLVELITEKAEFELPSPVAGRLAAIFAPERATVPVGFILCALAETDEPLPDIESMNAETVSRHHDELLGLPPAPAGDASQTAPESGQPIASARSPAPSQLTPTGKVAASPAARRLAREKGVDLSDLAAWLGLARPISEDDVRRFLEGAPH